MKNANVIDVLIESIKSDQELLISNDKQMEILKEERKEVANRLKGYRTDVTVLLKYADEKHKEQIEALGLDLSESTSQSMNLVANLVMEIVMKAKDNTLTNGALYEAYVQAQKSPEEAVNYTEFNIKCRTLFNTQRLLRSKGKDATNSREDIISLNGRVLAKEKEPQESVHEKVHDMQETVSEEAQEKTQDKHQKAKENAKGKLS